MDDSRIKAIYTVYLDVIAPFITKLETLEGKFPVELFNEVRAIFTHLARCYKTSDQSVIDDNITKAERHVKRATLDCFKFMCFALDNQYHTFEKMYKYVDLSLIDNGEFLPKLSYMRNEAVKSLNKAKELELVSENIEDTFDYFQDAYNKFSNVHKLLDGAKVKMQRLKHKAIGSQTVNYIIGGIGVAGTIFTIVTYFMK